MSLRYRRLRHISVLLSRIFSGNRLQPSREAINFCSSFSFSVHDSGSYSSDWKILDKGFHSQRYSTILQVTNESSPLLVDDILSFIQSTSRELQGPDHCWLNRAEGDEVCFKKDGIFLVIVGQFFENSQIVTMIEKIKSLQQKYSELCVIGVHSGNSIGNAAAQTYLIELVMKEYITFPILLSSKNFLEMENGACYILFRDLRTPIIYNEKDLDLGMLNKGIEELYVQQNENVVNRNPSSYNSKNTWVKQTEVIKEPDLSSALQNMLLYFPGCISADESSDRLFLSDSNHHRIIIMDGNGKIIDCIGSSPGFEDGEFESAKLLRPAGSFYNDAENCLYIVDSENQAIRRADMERRVLETLYPICSVRKNSGIWAWIANKMGFMMKMDSKSKQFDSQLLVFPWHLLESVDDSFLIINRSFETLWTMDLASGKIKECIKGFPKILETYGPLIMDKVYLLKQMPHDWLQHHIDVNSSPKGLPFASLISAVTTFQHFLVACDTVAQGVMKLDRESGVRSNFQFSNFGILGFPYWLSFHLERTYSNAPPCGGWTDHLQSFIFLPGRIDIRLNIDIPMDVELVEPLQEGCIWRQARGAAAEVLGRGCIVESSEKVGVAQQWYDDLDNLAFSTPESESEITGEDSNMTSDVKSEDGRIHIDCAINTSPGTSEVIICGALHLRLKRDPDLKEDSREKDASRIADIMNRGRRTDACIQLLKSNADLRNLIFMRPLHVRIKLDCGDHPKADNGKDIILTNSSMEVNVTLGT